MRDDLKPCPFCGGEAFFREIFEYGVKVVCKNCWNESKIYHDEIDAIIAWNSRIEPTFTSDELDAIRRIFDERYPRCRELPEIEQSIIDKCAKALKGARNDTGNI